MSCCVGQVNTIEHEERYYRRVRQGLQTATQTRLDIVQQRPMKHSSSEGMLLPRRDLKQTSLVDSPSRRELTATLPHTSTQADGRVCVYISCLLCPAPVGEGAL